MYQYRAKVIKVYDGDTIIIDIDCGFGIIYTEQKVRLARINAPEVKGAEKPQGDASRDFLKAMIEGKEITIDTIKDKKEKYGRYLGEITFEGKNINDEMVVSGHAEYKEY